MMQNGRKKLMVQQTALRPLMQHSGSFKEAMEGFFRQHAGLHTAAVSQGREWSYEDVLLNDLPEPAWRQISGPDGHSIAWCIWHIARIEDVATNLLIAGQEQVFNADGWFEKLGVPFRHTGNAMSEAEMAEISRQLDLEALRAYRAAVGTRTREIAGRLSPEDLGRKVEPAQIQRVWDEGALVPEAAGIADYWSKRDIAGLLLMPATRHSLVHLNEVLNLWGKV